jgi:hypothetical protein
MYLKWVLLSSIYLMLMTMQDYGGNYFLKHFAQVVYIHADYNKHLAFLVSSIVNHWVLLHSLYIY